MQSRDDAARLRIDELAAASGIAVGTIRFYQREGLVPPPEREGRIGWYPASTLDLLERIRALQAQGLPVAVIGDLLRREREGAEAAPWLQSAVLGPPARRRVPEAWLRDAGLSEADVDGLVATGLLTRRADGGFDALPGVLEMTRDLLDGGVTPEAFRAGAERVADRLRAVAEALADLGWGLFEPARERLEADPSAVPDTVADLERMGQLARQLVATLFPTILDEVVRERIEAYVLELATRTTEKDHA